MRTAKRGVEWVSFTKGGLLKKIAIFLTILAVLIIIPGMVSAFQPKSLGIGHGQRYDGLIISL
jgi:hypothetical protein